MLRATRPGILGKIAGDLDRALADRRATGAAGQALRRTLAAGDGWAVSDVVCTSGPRDVAAHVTDCVRTIERDPAAPTSLGRLASAAGLSSFQFLRAFRSLTGVTPHRFVLRARLRSAAARLVDNDSRVIDVALDTGFGDLSNFNHAFRAEFGATPTAFRDRSFVTAVLGNR